MEETEQTLLEAKDLEITFHGRDEKTEAVRGISFTLKDGKVLAIVGESGSGKSVTALSLTRLLPEPPTCTVSGEVELMGKNLLAISKKEIRQVRGKEIAYIFQEPSTSLNPVFSIGYQIAEAIKLHLPEVKNIQERVVDSLRRVGIRDPEKRYKDYPHQLSGGMQQRVMIAMALACEPRILVADEPTTALDVTIQKQIMDLLKELKENLGMSIILITHNFGIIADFADDVIVMFRGKIVESGSVGSVLNNPQHPYTKALLACIPQIGKEQDRLTTIDYAQLDA